jgi:hypothetical protein
LKRVKVPLRAAPKGAILTYRPGDKINIMSNLNPLSRTPKTEYQKARDALIPEAERIADEVVPHVKENIALRSKWTRVFFREMDKMVRERGI